MWFKKLLAWFALSWQSNIESSIATSMWADGYTDFEIDMAIEDYRKSKRDH